MVEAAGIEAKDSHINDLQHIGQSDPNTGQDLSQPGQYQDVPTVPSVEHGTASTLALPCPGQPSRQENANQVHSICIAANDQLLGVDAQFLMIVEEWHSLPVAVQKGILAMVHATATKPSSDL